MLETIQDAILDPATETLERQRWAQVLEFMKKNQWVNANEYFLFHFRDIDNFGDQLLLFCNTVQANEFRMPRERFRQEARRLIRRHRQGLLSELRFALDDLYICVLNKYPNRWKRQLEQTIKTLTHAEVLKEGE